MGAAIAQKLVDTVLNTRRNRESRKRPKKKKKKSEKTILVLHFEIIVNLITIFL